MGRKPSKPRSNILFGDAIGPTVEQDYILFWACYFCDRIQSYLDRPHPRKATQLTFGGYEKSCMTLGTLYLANYGTIVYSGQILHDPRYFIPWEVWYYSIFRSGQDF